MAIDHRSELANIHRFDQLVKYLRDEMGWPISQDSFDDDDELFYDFTTEELGIDMKNAAKIQKIQRLRPLSTHQPWGIFFVKFEPKHLPVVALRRILGQVTLKKRASANNPEQAAWSADDLLFVSNYGEGESRQISFAHFAQSEVKKDLPTLKVLGWDNFDTKLHLDHVADLLTEKLSWPNDEENQIEWRKQWRSAFTLTHKEVINTSKNLSKELAVLARNIRDRIKTILAIETEDGPITKLMESFKKSLIHDLDEAGFADMYAQTIAYGLLSARITNPSGDSADDIIEAMPVTNPFLKELMETFLNVGGRKKSNSKPIGIDFDELGVSEIVELLDASNMEAVVRDFGDRNPQEDPVIHFFEGFLEEYDKKIRKDRGVFYTPRPVVSFIVRSVDELLRTEFNLEDGLADITTWREMTGRIDNLKIPEGISPDQAFVQILDPATGTGTFLVEVIDLINKTMTEKWHSKDYDKKKINKLWNNYVSEHLLPRLYGYELMMAPYAIAHMKIGLKLYETGYHFESGQRARIYLTNALEPAQDFTGTLEFAIPALAHEAKAVNTIKRDHRFTVVLGNPPYSQLSSNLGDEQRKMVEVYKSIDGERIKERGALQFEKNIQDDYVKFIRLVERTIVEAGSGISGLITNHAFIDNTTFRGMRWHLTKSFSSIWVTDLLGNANRGLTGGDRNVFDIKQGVAVSFFCRSSSGASNCGIIHSEVRGNRSSKYDLLSQELIQGLSSRQFFPTEPMFFFVPPSEFEAEFLSGISIDKLFEQQSVGIITARDHLVIDFDFKELSNRIKRFVSSTLDDNDLLAEFQVSSKKGWDFQQARKRLPEVDSVDEFIRPISYRPMDQRWIFYHNGLVWGKANPTFQHILDRDNLALMTTRKVEAGIFAHVGVISTLSELHTVSMKESNYVMPLFRYEDIGIFGNSEIRRVSNLCTTSVEQLMSALIIKDIHDAESVFGYVCGLLHSPEYRLRFQNSLTNYFPHICKPGSDDLFVEISKLGLDIVDLHLHRVNHYQGFSRLIKGTESSRVEKISYSDETVWIDKAKTLGFKDVPEKVWSFRIGSYQVCEKWLKDRGPKKGNPGRILSNEDIDHYQKIIAALSGMIRIMTEIDKVIENHGGWPGAFQNN